MFLLKFHSSVCNSARSVAWIQVFISSYNRRWTINRSPWVKSVSYRFDDGMCVQVLLWTFTYNVVYLNATQHTICDIAVSPNSNDFLHLWRSAPSCPADSFLALAGKGCEPVWGMYGNEKKGEWQLGNCAPPELDEEDGCMDTTLCLYTHYNRLSYLISNTRNLCKRLM